MEKIAKRLLYCSSFLLASCSTHVETVASKMTESAFAAVGIASNSKTAPPRSLIVQVDAARDLNAGVDGQGLPTVARVYKLRSPTAFMAAPYVHFTTAEKEKLSLAGDVIEVKEIVLLPGQTTVIEESMPSEAAYLGVIAMFRTPSPNRWRLTFSKPPGDRHVVKIGAHTCALTATTLAPLGMTLNESTHLSASRCTSPLLHSKK